MGRLDGQMMGESRDGRAEHLRVVICDDSRLNRDCLGLALGLHGVMSDVAWDLRSLLNCLNGRVPDVLLVNIATPDSATLLQMGLDLGPDVRVIVTGLSADRESEVVSCAESGVHGLHLRTEPLEDLMTVLRGEARCSTQISAILMRRVYALARQPTPESMALLLTDREIEVLNMIEEGLSNKQIASRLIVSISTVKNHAQSLFRKLGVSSRMEAVAVSRAMRSVGAGSA